MWTTGTVAAAGAGLGLVLGSTTAAVASHVGVQRAGGDAQVAREGRDPATGTQSDDDRFNLEGRTRLALGLGGLATEGVALGALVLGRRSVAAVVAAAGGGLLAASLVGPGSITPVTQPYGLLTSNLVTMGNAASAELHRRLPPTNPTVADRLPRIAPSGVPTEAKPTDGDALRAAKLRLLPGTPDLAHATTQARRTLASIDWSKRDVVVWVPGTGEDMLPGDWNAKVRKEFGKRATSVYVDYPADTAFSSSASTGMETLRQVLAGIADHGGDHRVLLAGFSQGAWVIADTLDVPDAHALVDRVVLFGNAGGATHHYADGHDPKVVEVDDASDPVTWPIRGTETAYRAMEDIRDGHPLRAIVPTVTTAVRNPGLAAYMWSKTTDAERWINAADPHWYGDAYRDGATWLDTGTAAQPAAPTR